MTARKTGNRSSDVERLVADSDSSSFAKLLGLKTIEAHRGYAVSSLKLSKKKHVNFQGGTHGAVLFAVADHACGICGNSMERKAVLLNLSMNYVSSPALGSIIEAEARMVHEGKTTGTMVISVKDRDGKLLAHCQTTIYFLSA
ncbi:MAG: PaaI family thioesterase [Deltaproteobacteria bacterium]|nr:PaaI family thioesterase [Deltaproteobacteria bacterium]